MRYLIVLLALIAFASLILTSSGASSQTSCPALNFSSLPAGTVLGDQFPGVHISGLGNHGGPDEVILFDSNAPPTHDPDLFVHLGQIALLPKNTIDNNHDGLVDDPDENNYGGKQTYKFDQPMHVGSFLAIDKDHDTPDKAIAYNTGGNVIKTVSIPKAGNGSVQKIEVNADNVSKLVIDYTESEAFAGIEICVTASALAEVTAPVAASQEVSNTAVLGVEQGPSEEQPLALPETGGRP